MTDREKLNKILSDNNIIKSINDNLYYLEKIIPEITSMFLFPQNNPNYHLDVWNHTLCALDNSENDLTVRLVLLFNDIGKPFAYKDDEDGIRNFTHHSLVSAVIAKDILKRLNYDYEEIEYICELILRHDLKIEDNVINKNNFTMLETLLKIQHADVLAQHPDKREEKLKEYNEITEKVKKLKK